MRFGCIRPHAKACSGNESIFPANKNSVESLTAPEVLYVPGIYLAKFAIGSLVSVSLISHLVP